MESKWMTWRIVYLVTLVQVVLLNAYYGACMVSDLLQPPPTTILTVRDLIDSKLHVGYVDNRRNRDLFQDISDPLANELYKKKIKSPKTSAFPFEAAIQKLQQEHFAIHDEAIALYTIIEQTFNNDDKCAMKEIVMFTPRMTYTSVQKGSPYKKLLTFGFRKMLENGVMARELSIWRPEPPKCLYMDKFYPVDMETVAVALFIAVFGAFMAAVIVFLERQHDFKCFWKKKGD
ncbi:ionotropic receptor 75a-like [Periplaneta americana]|uniref:ionotropic receptor 75a-like n=1 Tax=Periplaneta americana TaxID=6978 RepID=UPI0037E77AB7